MASKSDITLCTTCGKDAAMKCPQCRRRAYCNIECQKQDWKKHRRICFPEGATCTRCLKVIDSTNFDNCTVKHPTHMLQDMGSMIGGGQSSWSFACKACHQSFTKTSTSFDNKNEADITEGAKFCYSGPHTIKPLKEDDERRVRDDILVLYSGPNLQKEIDEIPSKKPNLRILVIESTGCYDESRTPKLNISMPELKTLKLTDVAFSKINLNTELTPKVEELEMQNIPDDCDLTILLPELRSFSMHYYGPPEDDNDNWIQNMLSCATKLQTFDSYKLRVGPELIFASNDLTHIRLHRAELLYSLTAYAPKLRELSLQACYSLDGDLFILDSHPNFSKPSGPLSHFIVDTTNACISPSIAQTLKNNSRITWHGEEEEW